MFLWGSYSGSLIIGLATFSSSGTTLTAGGLRLALATSYDRLIKGCSNICSGTLGCASLSSLTDYLTLLMLGLF